MYSLDTVKQWVPPHELWPLSKIGVASLWKNFWCLEIILGTYISYSLRQVGKIHPCFHPFQPEVLR